MTDFEEILMMGSSVVSIIILDNSPQVRVPNAAFVVTNGHAILNAMSCHGKEAFSES